MDAPIILDCGDPPTYTLGHRYDPLPGVRLEDPSPWTCRCGQSYLAHGIGAGYATTGEGRTLCYRHAEDAEVADFARAESWTGYHAGDTITTWTGRQIARVTESWLTGGHAAGLMRHIRATGPDGSRWWGKYLDGWGEAVTLRRSKAAR